MWAKIPIKNSHVFLLERQVGIKHDVMSDLPVSEFHFIN
jgi:hypothetical protein